MLLGACGGCPAAAYKILTDLAYLNRKLEAQAEELGAIYRTQTEATLRWQRSMDAALEANNKASAWSGVAAGVGAAAAVAVALAAASVWRR